MSAQVGVKVKISFESLLSWSALWIREQAAAEHGGDSVKGAPRANLVPKIRDVQLEACST